MKYYKLIEENKIIGVITSYDFVKYSPITDCYIGATDLDGEYACYKDKLYRSTWMQPIKQYTPFEEVLIISINKEEYDSFVEALQLNEKINNSKTEEELYEEQIEETINIPIDPINSTSVEFIRTLTLNNIRYECRKTIEAGFDWKGKHYSLTTQDQLNLTDLNMLADVQNEIPYHAGGEEVKLYSAAEIKELAAEATKFKIYQTTYYNSLKNYVNSLQTIEEIADITYGMEIPEEYKTEALKSLEG